MKVIKSFRLEPKLVTKLEKLASSQNRSLNNVVEMALENLVKKPKNGNTKKS